MNVDYFLLTDLKNSSNSLHLYFEYLSSYSFSFISDKAKGISVPFIFLLASSCSLLCFSMFFRCVNITDHRKKKKKEDFKMI